MASDPIQTDIASNSFQLDMALNSFHPDVAPNPIQTNEVSDPILKLIDESLYAELQSISQPYLNTGTFVCRLIKKICNYTQVTYTNPPEKCMYFSLWHRPIFHVYEYTLKSKMNNDEKVHVERVLSKDYPHASELTKFACIWYKYDPKNAYKMFAVDGILGNHPKTYVNDAFSTQFVQHNHAVRCLYDCNFSDEPMNPEQVKRIVEEAFTRNEDEYESDNEGLDHDFVRMVGLYSDIVKEEEMKLVAADRRARVQAQQQHTPNKRKKTTKPTELIEPHSP